MRTSLTRTLATALVTTLATFTLVAGALPAQASTSKVTDGDDVETPLDLASAKLQTKGNKIVATFGMHDAVTDEQLAAPSSIGVDFQINEKTVRGMGVRVVEGVLRAQVCTYKQGGPVLGSGCSDVKAVRLDDRTFQLTVGRAKVSKAKVLRWRASAGYFVSACSDPLACLDTAPGGLDKFKKWKV